MAKNEELYGNNEHPDKLNDFKYINSNGIELEKLKNKTVLIIGEMDSINEFLTYSLLLRNDLFSDNINVISIAGIKKCNRDDVTVFQNFFDGFESISKKEIDYIIYLFSNDKDLFKATPGSILEREKMLVSSVMALAMKKNSRVLFVSSIDIYGAVHNGFKPIKENDAGYISLNDSENLSELSARFNETLAFTLSAEKNISVSFARLPMVYGNYSSDTVSNSEIYKLLLNYKNGTALLPPLPDERISVLYIAECVRALLFLLINGKTREAYNVAFDNNITTFRDILNIADRITGKTPSFGEAEESSYMTPCRILDGAKLFELGFKNSLTLEQGIQRTLAQFILRSEVS